MESLTWRNILRVVLLAIFPWAPAYLFERADFWFGQHNNAYWYYQFSGTRFEADIVSFALGGVLVAYLLRPRWAVLQLFVSASLIYALFYVACPTYLAGTIWRSDCYSPGPDGLGGIRLSTLLFCLGALPAVVRVSYEGDSLNRRLRPWIAIFGAFVVSVATAWFPLASWYAGAIYVPAFVVFQAALVFGVTGIAAGILAARIGRSIVVAAISGPISIILISMFLWTILCPACDGNLLFLIVPSWGLFALIGGVLELGIPSKLSIGPLRQFNPRLEDLRRIGIAVVLFFSLWTLVLFNFWDPNVLYATSISPSPGQTIIGTPTFPYVGGYYNSIKYRVCCVEVGVSFNEVDLKALAPDNFLMAGMGVQSPNCCIDGWDFGWRADRFILSNGTQLVSGSTWDTCDGNANCGGAIWAHLRYHSEQRINPPSITTPVYLKMMWQYDQPNWHMDWYFNYTGLQWTRFGSFVRDFREGFYFDIGIDGAANHPCYCALFYQFGVASKFPVQGWSVDLIYPSFVYPGGSWRLMEHASIIQGIDSFWKGNYRWGGQSYNGVSMSSNRLDMTIPPNVLRLTYSGTGTLRDGTTIW